MGQLKNTKPKLECVNRKNNPCSNRQYNLLFVRLYVCLNYLLYRRIPQYLVSCGKFFPFTRVDDRLCVNTSVAGKFRYVKVSHGWFLRVAFLLGGVVTLTVGCADPSAVPSQEPQETVSGGEASLAQMQVASQQHRWNDAWKHADEVLIAHRNDPEKIEFVAQVAFNSGRQSEAADLLVEAARVDRWASDGRIQHALTALLSVGRLFEGVDLLRTAVKQSPEKNVLRRTLFDLLIATEQHSEAAVHRRHLIRSRDFDLDLLLAASSYERRTEEIASLDQMVLRNPGDLRPKIGAAKQHLDQGRNDQAIALLRSITQKHADFVAAHVLLGRALVRLGRYDDLITWSESIPDAAHADSDFWLTMGDWASQEGDTRTALAAYGQAAKIGGDRVGPWQKLASLVAGESGLGRDVSLIKNRADLLMQLRQDYAEGNTRGIDSPETALAIAKTTQDLGWLWEAEAWTAVGLTMNAVTGEQKAKLEQRRGSIIAQLRNQSPWDTEIENVTWDWLPAISAGDALAKLGGRRTSIESAETASLGGGTETTGMRLQFANEADQRGLSFFGRAADDLSEPGVLNSQMLGCGGGTIDYDLDGWPDVYLANAGGTPKQEDSAAGAMFRNRDGFFHDVSRSGGLIDRGFGTGVCVGDVNEDGFDDLLVLNYGRNRIWINNGDGTFNDHSERLLPDDAVWSTSGAIADINADGLCDIVIANYCAGLEPATLHCRVVNTDFIRSCSPNQFPSEPDHFYAGTPEGRFIDASESWNAKPAILGRGLGVVAGSFDNVQGIDVLIANDMTTNHYWSATTKGESFQFNESGSIRGVAADGQSRSQGSMGIAVADFNDDQIADFYVSNYEHEYNLLSLSQDAIGWRDQTSIMQLATPTMPLVGFGTQAIDFGNDGSRELIVTNGHVDDYQAVVPASRYAQPIELFSQDSSGRFHSVRESIECEYFQSPHIGRALWAIDANRDGKTDVLVTHQSEPTALLVNRTESKHAHVCFRLVAKQDSRAAVGSVIKIKTQNGKAQETAFLTSGDGYLCSNERCVRFGLGDDHADIRAEVRWPSGKVQVWSSLAVDREWLLIEDEEAFSLDHKR